MNYNNIIVHIFSTAAHLVRSTQSLYAITSFSSVS